MELGTGAQPNPLGLSEAEDLGALIIRWTWFIAYSLAQLFEALSLMGLAIAIGHSVFKTQTFCLDLAGANCRVKPVDVENRAGIRLVPREHRQHPGTALAID